MTSKHLTTLLISVLACICCFGQTANLIEGIVKEGDSSQSAIQAAVILMSARDSSVVDGTLTDEDGAFAIDAAPGDYIVKVSLLGYFPKFINLHKTPSLEPISLGNIVLAPDVQTLSSAVVRAKVEPMTVVEDTIVYNAAAYRVAADASLEELVRKIPGIEVTSSGGVLLHGRPVNQLYVNGKRFFGTNVSTGLKNLSADMVENIRAYERESDEARLSGVDDGEAEPVLDIGVKKHMLDKWRVNINAGGGTSERYLAKGSANRIGKEQQFSAVASRRNTNGRSGMTVTGFNQVGGGSSGDAAVSDVGFSFSKQRKNSNWTGSFQYGDRDTEVEGRGRSETINASSSSWNNTNSSSNSITPKVKISVNGELHSSKYDSWLINPTFSYEYNGRLNHTLGRSFKEDPDQFGLDPNNYLGFDLPDDPFLSIRQNGTDNSSASYQSKVNGSLSVQYSHRSKLKKNRSISVKGTVSLTNSGSDSYNSYRTRYYRISSNPDSVSTKIFYNDQDDKAILSSVQATWSEPVKKGFYVQAVYRLEYKHATQDKGCYDIASIDRDWSVLQSLRRGRQMDNLPENWTDGLSEQFSYGCTYDMIVNNLAISGKLSRKKVYASFGVAVKPTQSLFHYPLNGKTENINVTSVYVVPTLNLRYTFSKTSKLTMRYNTRTSAPALSSLMPVVNGTNPLNVRTGNPYLEVPMTHDANLSYNYSSMKKQTSFVCSVNWSMVDNAVSSSCEYDDDSGARTYTPQNIDGNWRVGGSTALTKTFAGGMFSITNHASGEYRNDASYLYNSKLHADQINNTTRIMLRELFEGSFRSSYFEGVLGAGVNYTDELSSLKPEKRQTPMTYIANAAVVASAPWKTRLETNFSLLMQRGYTYSELNKNYYIWNIELSQTFLKKGVVRLCWYDILKSQENLTRGFSSSKRAITTYNGVCSYAMLRVSWTF